MHDILGLIKKSKQGFKDMLSFSLLSFIKQFDGTSV